MIMNPIGLIEFINSPSNSEGFLEGIGQGLSTNAGVTAMWAHMVAGDIFATRWIWQNSVKNKDKKYDESSWSDEVSKKYKTNHTIETIDGNDLKLNPKEVVLSFDEPYSDPSIFPSFLIYKINIRRRAFFLCKIIYLLNL